MSRMKMKREFIPPRHEALQYQNAIHMCREIQGPILDTSMVVQTRGRHSTLIPPEVLVRRGVHIG